MFGVDTERVFALLTRQAEALERMAEAAESANTKLDELLDILSSGTG